MNPRDYEATLDRISETAQALKTELRWGRAIAATGDRLTPTDPKRASKGGKSDPTGSAATDRSRRKHARAVREAERLIDAAWGTLERAAGKPLSRRTTGPEHKAGSWLRPGELDLLQDAQTRRNDRGEGYGS